MIQKQREHAERIEFVSQESKEAVLEKYGYTLPTDAKCIVCGIHVISSNLGAIARRDGNIVVVCDKEECLVKSKLFLDIGH